LKLKTKLVAGAGSLVMATSMMAMAAPAAHAVVTTDGTCTGQVSLVKISSPVKGVGLTDQTERSVKVAGALAKDQSTKALVNGGGTCHGIYRAGDKHVPSGAPGSGNVVVAPTSLDSQSISLLGNSGCANGATAIAVDATVADAYPLTGKITQKWHSTYIDLLTLAPKNYASQADVTLLGFNPSYLDVVDVGGTVLTGVNAGATVSGNIWEDPVAKTGGSDQYNTGYTLDIASAAGCADGTAGNANLTIVLSGGGGASSTSLLGSTGTAGLTFSSGE
jgi:hypothetical protein